MTRGEVFLSAIELLQNGMSVELTGERGSGRTHTLGRIRDHFVRLGWRTVNIRGAHGLSRSPFTALALSGIFDPSEGRAGPLLTSFRALEELMAGHRTVVIVDDAEAVDESSWSVISAASSRSHVPVIFSRSSSEQPEHPGFRPETISSLFTVELPPMTYAELESTLESVMESKVDPVTMTRVFAKAGGNIGLALALLDGARLAGRVPQRNGALTALGTLWSPALQALSQSILHPLSPAEVSLLRTLALLGPAEVGTAVRIVDEDSLLELERRSFVRIIEVRDRLIATVDPPILVEYFRHERGPGRRASVLRAIDKSLAGGRGFEPITPGEADEESPATFVRLVHERLRRRTLHAREDWRLRPDLTTATVLLRALSADLGNTDDEAAGLIAIADDIEGRPRDRAEWEVARATYVAHDLRMPAEAVTKLLTAAGDISIAEEALRMRAEAMLLEMEIAPLATAEPFADVDLASLGLPAREAVLLARLEWLTAMGRIRDADALAIAHHTPDSGDPRLDTVTTVAALAMGRFTLAHRRSQAKLEEARADFDARRLRVYSFLTAVSAVMLRRFDEAERVITAPATVGSPASEAPLSFTGLMTLSAYFAVNRGNSALAGQFLDRLAESGIPDGPFPGLQRGLVAARWAALESDSASAERISHDLGQELWARGARLAAAVAYLDGQRATPSSTAWSEVRERVISIDSPAMERWARFTDALVQRDVDALLASVDEVAKTGEHAHAAQLAEIALRLLALGPVEASGAAAKALEGIVAAAPRQRTVGQIDLSAREREVAELIASGMSNPMIAEALVVSVRTVESHVNRLLRKLGAADRNDIREFIRSGHTAP